MLLNSVARSSSGQSDTNSNEGAATQQLPLPMPLPLPMSQRRSLDPVLLNQLGTQIFHSHPTYLDTSKMAHQQPKAPIDTSSNENFSIIQIDGEAPLEYPKPAHIETKLHDAIDYDEKQFDNESMLSTADVCPICLDGYQDGLSTTRTLPW